MTRIPNDYLLKKNYLDHNASQLECLVLGSSHSYYGLDPQYFTGKTFNAGYVSQTLNFDYMILEKYKEHLANLKVIVLPISYFSFFNKLEMGDESWRVVNYIKYSNLKFSYSWKYQVEIFSLHFNLIMYKLYKYYLRGESNITSSPLGSALASTSGSGNRLEESGKNAAARHSVGHLNTASNRQMFVDNEQFLRSILHICQQKDIKVILFMPPAHTAYSHHLHADQLTTTINKANEITAEFPNSIFINFLSDPYFDAEDFGDADHMSQEGAKKLSLLLDEIINE